MVTVTKELMEQGLSRNGGHSGKQLKALGVKRVPNDKGWLHELYGTLITDEQKNTFLALKDYHLNRKIPHFNEPRLF